MGKYNEVRDVQSQIEALTRRLSELETAPRFTSVSLADGTSIKVNAGGSINVLDGGLIQISDESVLYIDNSASIEVADGGDINILPGGQIKMDPGSELISAGMLQVLGSIALPAGVIDNQALASPIAVALASTTTRTAWPVTATYANLATAIIQVPGGYTRAAVFGIGSVMFKDTTPNWIESRIVFNDLVIGSQVRSSSELRLSQTVIHTTLLTELTNEIMIDVELKAEHNSTDNDGRTAVVSGFAVFFR